jgi:hypothetical protein
MFRDQVIHGFDDPPPDACRKCADLALEANSEIDCATIMPTTGRLGDPMRGRPSRGISSFFDIFREIQVELASRNSRVLHTIRIQALDEVTQTHSGLHIRVLIDNHRKCAQQEILSVVVRQFVRYPGDAVLWIKLLKCPRNPRRTSAAVIDAYKIG